jgi:hypothetical protein
LTGFGVAKARFGYAWSHLGTASAEFPAFNGHISHFPCSGRAWERRQHVLRAGPGRGRSGTPHGRPPARRGATGSNPQKGASRQKVVLPQAPRLSVKPLPQFCKKKRGFDPIKKKSRPSRTGQSGSPFEKPRQAPAWCRTRGGGSLRCQWPELTSHKCPNIREVYASRGDCHETLPRTRLAPS